MERDRLLLGILFLASTCTEATAQTVTGGDAVVTSGYDNKFYHLIGTYQGWDPEAVYIAGYNNFNNSGVATKRVRMGGLVMELQDGTTKLSGNLFLETEGKQLQAPYYGFNQMFPQPANSSNIAIFANGTSGTVDFVGGGSGWRFVPPSSASYQEPVATVDQSGNLHARGQVLASTASFSLDDFSGNNIAVGNDTYLGDINEAHTASLKGLSDPKQGWLRFEQGKNEDKKGCTSLPCPTTETGAPVWETWPQRPTRGVTPTATTRSTR